MAQEFSLGGRAHANGASTGGGYWFVYATDGRGAIAGTGDLGVAGCCRWIGARMKTRRRHGGGGGDPLDLFLGVAEL